jgi:hypothetical protein
VITEYNMGIEVGIASARPTHGPGLTATLVRGMASLGTGDQLLTCRIIAAGIASVCVAFAWSGRPDCATLEPYQHCN